MNQPITSKPSSHTPQASQSDSDGKQSLQVSAPSISLPKGGGAIRGIGEKFAANPVTGTGSMSVPIGIGWNLSLPAITSRTDKDLPPYRDGDTHWRSISKNNIITVYGSTSESRIADPVNADHAFSWLICQSCDDEGNAIICEYVVENADNVDLSNVSERNRVRSANRYQKTSATETGSRCLSIRSSAGSVRFDKDLI